MDPCVGACCDEGWQALVRAHAARTDTLRRGGGDHRAVILWQPQGQGAGGFAWEVRFMLLAFLAALATDRAICLTMGCSRSEWCNARDRTTFSESNCSRQSVEHSRRSSPTRWLSGSSNGAMSSDGV